MNILRARNVNDALSIAIWHMRTNGVQETSRNGPVLVSPGPVVTQYDKPRERVLFEPRRDCNHVFHLMEAIWMLAGANDVRWLLQFNSKFDQYAEGGITMHGAYGHRWRKHFGVDQITSLVRVLRNSPDTRQAVLGMWSPADDLGGQWKDRPCNTHVYFDRRGGKLNMMVNCRSNDVLWGAYGSNVVHFSILQELIASALDIPVGTYWQNSFNFHIYMSLPVARELLRSPPEDEDYNYYGYREHTGLVHPLLAPGEKLSTFLIDCEELVSGNTLFGTMFFQNVAYPLMRCYINRKEGEAMALNHVANCDWKLAFQQWCARRAEEKKHA